MYLLYRLQIESFNLRLLLEGKAIVASGIERRIKMKALKIITAVLLVTAIAAGAAFFISKGDKEPVSENPMPKSFSFDESGYTLNPALSVKGTNGEIFMPTDFGGIYYTASLDGKVAFFEYANGAMTPCALEVKQIKTTLAASYEKIPVTVNYIEKDGKVCGYGVYTADMGGGVDVYSYAFAKLTMKPAGYGTGHLLVVDFDKDNFYNPDKLYSEIYNFNLAKGTASTYVSNHTRMIDRNGTFRQDWTILTDDFIKNLGDAKYFLSSRYYNEDEKGQRADVMVLSNAYRPKIVVEDILGTWFVNDANGMHYLKKTANGFANILNVNNAEQTLSEFEGDFHADYLQSGKYIINKKSLVMTDLLTGASQTLKDIVIENADVFSVSPDGTKAVFAANGELNANNAPIQTLTYCTVDGSAEPVIYSEPMLFSESAGFVWLDNSSVMSVRALDGTGATAGSVVFTF